MARAAGGAGADQPPGGDVPLNPGHRLPNIPTWKLKHGKEELARVALDRTMFNLGYGMEATKPGERKFPSISKCFAKGVVLGELRRRGMPTYIGVDLSSPGRPGNAIIAVGLEHGSRRRYPLEVRYGNWTSPDTAGVLAEVCSHHNVQYIQVENNAYQQSLIDWVRKGQADFPYWMKIEAFTTGKNKADPQYGLPGLEIEFKNEAWVFPYAEWEGHPATCLCDWCRLAREIIDYPNAAQSDGVMALWFARDALNKWAPRSNNGRRLGNLNQR